MTISTLDPPGASPGHPDPDDGVFVFPASYAQQRLWFLDQLAPGSAVYNLPLAWRLRGPLDPATLEGALGEIVARHEPLRTTFATEEEVPVQVVSPPGWGLPFLPRIDLEALPAQRREREARRLAADEAARAFDLERGPLFRAALVRIGRGDHALLATFHHIVSDGVSLGVFQRELAAFYHAGVTGRPAPLPALPIQYADFAVWQRDWLEGEALEPQLAWWMAQLEGAPRVLELPFRARPAVSRQRGAWRAAGIPRKTANTLREVGQSEGATRFMTLLAAFEVLLHLCTGRDDLVVGTPVSGRTQVETEGLIGLFVNTLALRTDLAGVASFRELLARVRESALGAFGHQDLPFERLVEELQPERSLALNPLVQVTFTLQERGTDRGLDLEGVNAEPLLGSEDRGEGTAKFDLALFVEETPRGMAVRLDWDTDLMDEADALRLLESYRTLLAGIAEDPWRPLWSLPVLPGAARHQLLLEWNDSGSPWRDLPLAQRFAAQAVRTPDAVALVSGTETLSYAELDCRSNRLARRLRALGVGPEARVGVALERTPALIAALIAVHKAGGAYVPLDPGYPRERLALILQDAQEGVDDPVLVTTSSLLDRLPAFGGRTLLLDELPEEGPDGPLPPLASPGNLAYLIYTSGSTGRPKGVAIEHRSAAALLDWAAEVFAQEELSGVLAATSVTFDLSVYEIFLPLTRGGAVVLAENALALPELPARESVTLVNTVPSAMGALARSNGIPPSVRTVNLAGEPLKRALVNALYAVPTIESVYNLYGPSEDTTYSTWMRVPREEEREPTIGIPLANTRAHVLDRGLRPLPIGVPGELFLAGAGLARGYLNRPDLTAAAFVPDPFRSGERLYRTGDLARRLADGRLEFLGRIDYQVKVRGFRIELGEIESHLLAHPAVREAVVLALGEGAERSLVAYVAVPAGTAIEPAGFRDFLAGRLPAYMVPAVVILDALPLTANGKVDRKALASLAPDRHTEGDAAAGPRNATEELIAGIWADVLRVERVGVHDSFFDLGGHSLLATQLVSRVRETFRTDLPLRALFEAPTVAGLAVRVESARSALRQPLPPILPVPRDRDLPASFAQERLWFLEQLGGDVGTSYSLPSPLRLRGPLSVPALAAALGALADRHESLRTTFAANPDGIVLQRIAPAAGLPLPFVDLGALSDPEAEALMLAAGDARRPFDLQAGPLLRATLLRLADEDHALLLTMHHIVSDGWSVRVLIRELMALYAGGPLPALPVQYADFAAWQRGWLTGEMLDAEIAWWRERLAGLPAVLDLPTDRPRPAVRSSRGGVAGTVLPARLAAGMESLTRRAGATSFMTLLAVFQSLLRRYTGRDDLTVGTPIANRNRTETEGLVGFFVNTLVLRGDLSGDPTCLQFLRRTRDAALAAYDHQDLPFEKLVEALQPQRSLAYTPLFQVVFLFQADSPAPAPGGLELGSLRLAGDTAKFDLTLAASATADGLAVQAEYSRALFDAPTVLRMLEHFGVLLEAIVTEPGRRLSELPLLAQAERHVLLFEESATSARPSFFACLHERFEIQADLTPGAEALVAGEERLTYAGLDRRANRLARRLRRLGVGPEVRVGIALERNADLIVGLLAILKAGGAYVPLDPFYPQERLDLIREDAGCSVVVDRELLRDLDREEEGRLPAFAMPGNTAYLIYTSGSTGRPKGVAIEHRSADALIAWAERLFGPEELSGVLASTSIAFDLSVFELFLPLARGGRVILAENALALTDLPARDEVRLVNTVPSAIAELVRLGAVPESVRTVNLAGEPLKRALVDRIHALRHVEAVYNLYGPSEDTTYSTWTRVPRESGREPTIGVPIAGTKTRVLDSGLHLQPLGVPGELCLAGAGLARGYLNRPDLTAASFIPDPFGGPGERIYRTGDLARRLPGGELEFLGRIDHQVKVRGFRIELGEIESHLLAHPDVRDAVVLALGEGAERSLVAYVAGGEGESLRAHLAGRLPAYMVPASLVVLDALPLTPNGKVDRNALALIEPERDLSAPAALRTPVEELLAGIWSDLLGCGPVGPEDRFFDLGGHSLLATRVVSRAREVFGVELPLRALFEAPALSGLAARIEALRGEGLGLQAPPILPVPRQGNPAASFAQERLWFLEQLGGEPAAYNIPIVLSLRGPLSAGALEAALNEVVRRHEVLRTTFVSEGGGVAQVIAPWLRLPLPVVDLEEAEASEARRLALEEARRPFDLARGPLHRAILLRLAPGDGEEHLLLLTMHHIVSDGWSIGVLLRELSALYDAVPLPDLPIQYADFAAWQREWLSGGILDAQLGWWRERLAGAPAVLELPTDHPRPAMRSPRGGQRSVWLSAALSDGIGEVARGRGATPFMVLLSAFQALLGRLTGQEDLTVGSPVANRNRAETEGLIGFFVNILVLRGDLSGDPTFAELLARSREAALDAYARQDLPFEKLVTEVQPDRDLGRSPLFQVMLVVQNLPSAVREGWMLMPAPDEDGTAKFDLTLTFGASGGRLLAQAEYHRDLFDAATIDRLLGWLGVLLQAAVAEPEVRVSELPLLTEPERLQLLEAWNDTGSLRPDLCLHQRFEAQVALSPEADALVWGDERLSYSELDRRANRLARRLRRLGVGPEVRVGIALERSADMVAGLLAILKAGGAYVPLDPSYPPERLALILEDAPVLLTREELLERLPPFSGSVLCVNRDREGIESDAPLAVEIAPGNLAYLIYTSGSTGRPKGVAIEHRSAAALLAWAERELGAEELSGVLASTSITFDLSVFELFLPLARGGRVILADNALTLPDLPARDEVRLINTVPSVMAELVRLGAVPESVRTVNLAGEPLKRSLANRIYALPHVERVYNLYGPSEDTTYSTFTLVPRGTDREPTIGVPIAGTRAYVVDRFLRPLPVGVSGELCLAGEGLARGYLNRPDLTAASFVPDPFGAPGERVYRTGDLVRWSVAGDLEFLGRIDHQVKVRGFRIELGEIETVLLEHPGVREAVVLALGEGGERRLMACVSGEASPASLRSWVEGRLPAYMVPNSWVTLPALPLTPNGKVDRKALARIDPDREPVPVVAVTSRSPVEDLLAGIWSEVLKRSSVSSGDSFFELGGHSLLATQVVSRVREVLGVELPLRAVFEAPALAGLAARIEAARSEALDVQAPPVVRVARDGGLTASFAQERLWFLDRFGTDRASYNLPAAIHLGGRLDPAVLAAALGEIVRRHESLRTTFAVTGGSELRVLQVIGPAHPMVLPMVDLRALPERREEVARLAREEARRAFDLSGGPLLRATLLRSGEDEHTLLLTQHHIVSDGWSIGVLLRELTALYGASVEGRPSPLAELPVQYADFAVWQRAWLQGGMLERQLGWWRDHLAGAPAVLELPTDRPRPPVQSSRGGRLPLALSAALRDEVQALARRQGATSFMALLAVFQALLGRLAGRADVPVGTPVAGRNRAETEGLIGFFVNTLVLRADLRGDPGFRELLARSRETLLGAYAHQDLPFEKLVEELHPERSLAHSPLFQAMFILQNAPMDPLELPGVTAAAAVPDTGTTKFDLRLSLGETADGLAGSLLYNLDLFDPTTARRLASYYERLLSAAVAEPETPLSNLPLLGDAEVQHLLREWNDTRADWDLERPLHVWIEEQARRTPDAPALTFEDETLTYRELDDRAGRLAARLRRLGAGPETRVGIAAERSLELVAGLLGILKAGACYVPLDPSYPAERLSFMLEDSQDGIETPILLTQERLSGTLPPHRGRVLLLDEIMDAAPFAAPVVLPEHPAYVIYTSGSTGRPKGAVNSHRAIVNRLVWMQEEYGLTSGDVVLQKTPFSFDVSVWEFFWPLMVGARLVVARPGGHQDTAYLADLIRREEVTTLHFVPSMLQVFLEQPGVESCTSLRRVICSGEALPFELQQRFFAKLGGMAGLHNLYGPTEAAVDVTVWACDPGGARPIVPIGRPISNLGIHILDRSLSPAPMGVPGELHIAGVGLARGYLNRPAMTAERFIPDPFGPPGARLYRTGDLCRHLPDGRIEYLGRLDHQVKIRGFRIELGEIEATLCAHPSVKEAVVLAREDRPGDKRLVAYLTLSSSRADEALRRHLLASLPEYMVPSAFVVLPALPLSPNGKVDRKLLPAPEAAAPVDRERVAPRTPLEEHLAGLWRASLGVESVGIHDDFFALGGNSISGAILINRLQETLGEIVHVVVIFDAPTVERMAGYLVQGYPEAVERIWGRESLGQAGRAAKTGRRIGEDEIAGLRAIVTPLPPLTTEEPKNPAMVFVLSPPRSGSTLLRVLLAGHPRLFAPPELEMLNFNTLADRRAAYTGRDSFSLEGLIRAVMEVRGGGPDEAAATVESWEREGWTVGRAYRQLQEWLGDRVLIDKTPSYPLDLEILRRAEAGFEGARYIHLLRHPYGMIRSFEEARLEQVFFRYDHPFTRRELAELIWLVSQENILRFLDTVPEERRLLVRFEDLVRDPEPVLRGICDFLGLDFHPAMLRPYEDRSGRMTDGLHAESRMLGDVKFHTFSGVEESVAERWKEHYREDFLGDATARLAAGLGYEAGTVRSASAIPRHGIDPAVPVPLSFAQERLWFLAQLEPDSSFYNIPAALRLTGRLDVSAMERSLNAVRHRHSVLRAAFAATPEGPVQAVAGPFPVGLPIVDLGGLAEAARDAEAARLAREEARRPFDLEAGTLLRALLLRLEESGHVLLATMHHIASDGWSMGIFLSELSALYGALAQGRDPGLPELPVQYTDFALWQRERLRGETLEEQLAWWRDRLAGAPAVLELPTDRPRPPVQRFRGGQVPAVFGEDLGRDLNALGRRRSATLFMILLAGFQALLSRWSGQEDVSVGSPAAGRLWPESEPLIGFFTNTLVLRSRLAGELPFDELLARVQRGTIEAFAHQELPFEKVVEALRPERSLAHSPLFQVLFAFQNAPRSPIELPGLTLSSFHAEGGTAKFDLSLGLAERDGRIAGGIEYDADLFDSPTVARLLRGFEVLLRAAVKEPERRVADLPLLGPAEHQQVVVEWNTSSAPAPDCPLHELLAAQAARTPAAVAVVFQGEELTYRGLEARANRLARRLRRLGVGPEVRVGIALERTADLVVGLLAILKAGGAYVPLDPAHPRERLALILEDAQAPVLLTQEGLLGRLPPFSGRVLCVDRDREEIGREKEAPPAVEVAPGNLAYLIYTSGSTGRPKGVAIEHRSAAALLAWAGRELGTGDLCGVLASTSITFDLSVFELFLPLARGGRVILAENALALPDLPARDEVRLINTVPSAIAELVRLEAVPRSVRTVNLAGEPLKRALVERIYALPHVERVYNLYGPSEDTTYSTFVLVPRGGDREPTIGVPVAGTRAYVVDRGLRPLPMGVPGELCLAGAGLARGYLNRADLTAASFVPDPFGGPGERVYRTGDLARWMPSGELEFLGRIDHQVKVRGFRIELGEIETALLAHSSVREAVVLALGEGVERRLVACVVGEAGPGDLRTWLEGRLPSYMVPSVFAALDALPLTPNGKVDRKALARIEPERETGEASAVSAAVRTPAEELLAGIWAEVLRSGGIGARDNFFELGGHSLLATQVASRVREIFGVELPLRALFEAPTLETLAARVEAARREGLGGSAAPPLVRIGRSRMPASFGQERLWFLDRLGVTGPAYHLANALRLRGPLHIPALSGALSALARRHESLRTTFSVVEEEVVQVVSGPRALPLPVVDLRSLPAEPRQAELLRLAGEEARRQFDLERGPLVRATLIAVSRADEEHEEEHALFLAMHHIVSDGWSMQVLLRELAALYAALMEGRPATLPELPVQYADFAHWQRQWLRGEVLEARIAYWRRQMDGAPALLRLPLDHPRSPVQTFRGARWRVAVPALLTGQLEALGRRQGVSLFMTLLAAFQALLSRCSGGGDVPVGSPVANRDRLETEGVVGLFVNTLVLRADLSDDPAFTLLLRRVRDVVLDAHAHQDLPFEQLVQELRLDRNLSHSPLFQVMLLLQKAGKALELPGLALGGLEMDSRTAKYDLTLALAEDREGGRGLLGLVEYNRDLFEPATIARLVRHLESLLEGAAADPGRRLSDLPLLSAADRHQMLAEWNDTATPFPDHLCLHQPFETRVAEAPDAVAVIFEDRRLTYGELNRQANRLAHRLRSLGVGPGRLVAVHLERSPEMVVAVLGIHKAGGAYVPVEVSWPADRLRYILESERIGHVVTQASQLQALPSVPHVVCLDGPALEGMLDGNPEPSAGPEDLAYIIFTSGSTGRPKGVMVRHRPAVNLVHWVNTRFGVGPSDTLLFITALSFDLSVYDIFGILAAGGTVRIATPAELRDPEALVKILLEEPVTFWDSAPAALQQLVAWLPADPRPAALRLVFNSGDWIPVTLPDRVRQTFPKARFVSLGGATEATIWSNVFPVEEVSPEWTSIPYGRPIENARYHVLDERLSPCPIGVPGDLHIAGIAGGCLSDGYAGAPELTAQKYVPDPFGEAAGGRLYRTGDRARYRPDGNLEFLGRIDTQVKVRGYRIELGEIESVLMTHPAVREAVVLAREDTPGDQRLVAYLIPDGEAPTSLELRRFVQALLPEYMVPSAFLPLESWPLAATGKLDRKALPPPERALAKAEAPVLPDNGLERTLAEIWKEVIGLPEVGVRDNFFDVGGHSLLMARVHARLEEALGRKVSMVDLFQYPTIGALAAHLGPAVEVAPRIVVAPVSVERQGEDVAVIGLAGRFPGARNVDELWSNLRDRVESIRRFSEEELRAAGFGDEVLDPRFVRARGALDGPDLFDAAFFDYASREAQIIDPQQRHFLECAWEALENAGYGAEACRRRTGVFAGTTENTYVLNLLLNNALLRSVGRQQVAISNNADYLPTRVSYKLNLRGPSLNVQTACSTSLVAVHLARLSLLRGECDIALAGGVSVKSLEVAGYLYHEGGINSPDGHTRAFDERAQGVVGGSGVGIVVLKRLEDALADGDTIHAVIRGSAVNNDGTGKVGFTAPSVEGQAEVVREAHRAAGIEPGSISYVEAHGTGTAMGDPIEAQALIQAFGDTGKPGSCALGSIKTNIGHLDAAAGIAGLIKTVLSLENRTIPASLHFERPNPRIPFDGSPFFVNARTREWPADGTPRRAGVSSFGIGGTNAHAVVEEAPELPAGEPSLRPSRLLVLSAKTPTALDAATANLAGWLEAHPEASLDDVAFTLQVGRQPFRHRRAVVCGDREDAILALRDDSRVVTGSPAADPSVVFLFPGQGSQYARMGEELYEHEPVYRSALDRCCERLGFDLRELLEDPEADLGQTFLTQPALFAVEYALARLWMSWGIRPAAMLGHSVGEYVAACLAGVLSMEDALSLVEARGRLMQKLPAGSMLGVSLPEEEVRTWIEGRHLSLAAVNAPRSCVVSGPAGEVEALKVELEGRGIETRPLHTSHAFHSRMMEPVVEPFLERVRQVDLRPPRLPYVSNVTGTWITSGQATDPEYWARHLRQPVRFADGVSELLRLPDPVLLETGPGRTLGTLARQHPDRKAVRLAVSSLGHAKDRKPAVEAVLGALGRLWLVGVEVDWTAFWAAERRRRIPLPTYPFEHKSYWIGLAEGLGARSGKVELPAEEPAHPTPLPVGKTAPRNPVEETVAAVWRDLLGEDGFGVHDEFFDLGGSSLMAVQLGSLLRQALKVDLPLDFLFQAPTVAALAELVARLRPEDGRPAERPRSSCLVPLQAGNGRRPLFLVHQVGGNVYTFRALARALGKDQTVYGLRSRGLEDGEEPLARVEDMAEHYLELVRSVQPAGPYRIGGASMGGMVAFEMAHRLRAAGETVEILTLMDTPCGEQMPRHRVTGEEIVISAFAGRIELTPEELLPLSPDEQIAHALAEARHAGALAEDFDEGGARRLVRVLQSNVAALYAYQPQPYPGRMVFFRAEERRPGDPPRPEIAWIDLARGGCDVLLVSGNHETMHEPPHVLSMAERLRSHLAP